MAENIRNGVSSAARQTKKTETRMGVRSPNNEYPTLVEKRGIPNLQGRYHNMIQSSKPLRQCGPA